MRSRVLGSFNEAAMLEFQEHTPWLKLSQLGQMDNAAVATEPAPHYRLERAAPEARRLHEPTCTGEADIDMCALEKKRRRARLPLFASSWKQW